MAEAYRKDDPSLLAEVATPREQARVRNAIAELARQGKSLRPTLKSLAVESIEPAGVMTAVVSTLEVWDLRVVAVGSEQTVSESLAQENHLTYNLVEEHGKWLVLSRTLRNSSEPS